MSRSSRTTMEISEGVRFLQTFYEGTPVSQRNWEYRSYGSRVKDGGYTHEFTIKGRCIHRRVAAGTRWYLDGEQHPDLLSAIRSILCPTDSLKEKAEEKDSIFALLATTKGGP